MLKKQHTHIIQTMIEFVENEHELSKYLEWKQITISFYLIECLIEWNTIVCCSSMNDTYKHNNIRHKTTDLIETIYTMQIYLACL